ncbi:unnamed protein product, partial [Closterium sp. NIES-53]
TVEAASVGACEIACTGAVPAEASLSFTLDSGTLRCFFRDCTTVIPLPAPVPVTLADLTGHCVQLHCSPVSGSPLWLPCRSPPPLVRYELVEYRSPPGSVGRHHYSWGRARCGLYGHRD